MWPQERVSQLHFKHSCSVLLGYVSKQTTQVPTIQIAQQIFQEAWLCELGQDFGSIFLDSWAANQIYFA